jgi:hypothetical protein
MPKPKGTGKYGRPRYNQAAKVIAKFGGEITMLAELLGVSTNHNLSLAVRETVRDGWARAEFESSRSSSHWGAGKASSSPRDWLPERIVWEQ